MLTVAAKIPFATNETASERSAAAPAYGERVLVVDDIEANRDLLIRRLRRIGITNVIEAADGRAALDIILSTPLDLVLLDIMMPIMTGFEVLEAMAIDSRTTRLPVIVISAMNEIDAVVRAISLGAEDFLLKPFDPTLLRARVLATLEKKRLRDRIGAELSRKQNELAEARSLQMSLTPPCFRDARCRIEVVLEPAREVGGDLIDHEVLPDGRHLLVLGDVSDKGAAAALMMARTHALIRSLAHRADAGAVLSNLPDAAAALNAILSRRNDSCMFVTMLLALFDPATGGFDYVCCGHIPPFLCRTDGTIERLDVAGGVALGVVADACFQVGRVVLAPGDRLLVVSDGVTEAEAPDGGMFGEEPVLRLMRAGLTDLAPLVAAVKSHEAGTPQSDDLCALLLAYSSPH
jgi:sigma-B regulation protein RsbU (phosphoserine phosphatase)